MNILLITADQHKSSTIGAYGDPLGATPNLDRLAVEGTTFTRARTQNPFCQPARASILTGTYPRTHGVVRNGIDVPVEDGAETIASSLAKAGWSTALFGKAHFASNYPDFPTGAIESVPDAPRVPTDWNGPYHGFDEVALTGDVHNIRLAPQIGQWNWGFGPPPFGLHYGQFLFRDGFDQGVQRLRLMQPEAAGRKWDTTQTWPNHLDEVDHHTTWTADTAIDWLHRRPTDQPFFGWVSFADPHHPFDPPRPWSDRYSADDVVAVLPPVPADDLDGKPTFHAVWTQGFRGSDLEWVNPGWARFDLADKLRILAAYYGMIAQVDHAVGRIVDTLRQLDLLDDTLVVFTADHGDFMGDHDMMLKGPIHYTSLIGVPLIIRGPGFTPRQRLDRPVGTIDLAPTFAAIAGIEPGPENEGMPLIGTDREFVVTEDDTAPGFMELRTITTARHRLTLDLIDADNSELYDHDDDPGEHENRWRDPALRATRDELVDILHTHVERGISRQLPQVCAAG